MRWLPVLLLLGVRLHDALVRDPHLGYDAYTHCFYLTQVASGRFPLPDEGWVNYHPPLYYLLASWLSHGTGIPLLRSAMLLSCLCGCLTVGLTYLTARGLDERLAYPATLMMSLLPATLMTSAMVYNIALGEVLWALYVMLFLKAWLEPAPRLGREIALGLLAGLGMMARPEGIGLPFFLLLLWVRRRAGRDASLALLLQGTLCWALVSWFLLRNLALFGHFFVHNADPDTFPFLHSGIGQALTLPGFRSWFHYLNPGFSVWREPFWPGAYTSFGATVYASIWWDYFGAFLTAPRPIVGQLCLAAGMLPTALALGGALSSLRWRSWTLPATLILGWSLVMTAGITLSLWSYCADKGSYAYPGFLPACLLAARVLCTARYRTLVLWLLGGLALFIAWAFWA